MAKEHIGIDIGSQYTKIVRIILEPLPSVSSASIFPTPYGASSGAAGEKLDDEKFIGALDEAIGLSVLRNARVGINIPSAFINAMYFSLPRMKKQELKVASVNEARRKMIPPSAADDIFGYIPLEEKDKVKVLKSEVFVARSNSSIVKERVALFKKMGIIPSLITITPLAQLKALFKEPFNGDEDVTFVNIGAISIDIAIAHRGQVKFFRSVSNACRDIITSISSSLGISQEKAEEVLKTHGVPEIPFDIKDRVAIAEEIMRQKYEGGQSTQDVNLLELRLLLQPHLERIINELRRSFIYYKEQTGGERVERIFFSGGGSHIKNLVPSLARQIGGKCEIINILRNMHPPADETAAAILAKNSAIYACALGLAIGIESKKQEIINFLPSDLAQHEQMARIKLYSILAILALVAVCASAYFNSVFSARSLRMLLEEKKSQVALLAPAVKKGEILKKRGQRFKAIAEQSEALRKQNIKFEPLLVELSRLLPAEAILTSADISEGVGIQEGAIQKKSFAATSGLFLKLTGNIMSTYEEGLQILEKLKTDMQGSAYFKDITAVFSQPETLSPQAEEGDFPLTARKMRDFRMDARVVTTREK
ncbi:MAG: pilus assembly protein PilM [Candidatus Omnitrophica bacterium]|nr:pilus assembly protein PilM [Candidatus Omnitrophota bacterium]